MRRYKGKCEIFFGIEHRLRKEEMDGGAVQQRSQGRMDICRRFRDLPMKLQAARIVSTHQEEFLWQPTATWEQLWEWKKGRSVRSQEMKEESPRHG